MTTVLLQTQEKGFLTGARPTLWWSGCLFMWIRERGMTRLCKQSAVAVTSSTFIRLWFVWSAKREITLAGPLLRRSLRTVQTNKRDMIYVPWRKENTKTNSPWNKLCWLQQRTSCSWLVTKYFELLEIMIVKCTEQIHLCEMDRLL